MKRLLLFAALALFVVATTASAAYFYVAGQSFEDGSWWQASVVAEGQEDSPENAPCYINLSYGPSWCTYGSNCQARQNPIQLPHCPVGGGPYYPEP